MAAAGAFDGSIGIIAAAIMARAHPLPIGLRWSQESGNGTLTAATGCTWLG